MTIIPLLSQPTISTMLNSTSSAFYSVTTCIRSIKEEGPMNAIFAARLCQAVISAALLLLAT